MLFTPHCVHPWCPDGKSGSGEKIVRAVTQNLQGVGSSYLVATLVSDVGVQSRGAALI